VAFAVVLPLLAFVKSERRSARVRSLLRLAPPSGSPRLAAAAIVALAVLVGVAAAQPVIEQWDERPERVDAQVFFVLDTSRSMLASAGAGKPTRWDRATASARKLHEALGEVPVGIASMTDRVLPHVFPTSNPRSFESVLSYSIGIDRPASDQAGDARATDLNATKAFTDGNYFRGAQRRLLVVFTDGESKRIDTGELTGAFSGGLIDTILLRFWAEGERVYGPDGLEEAYVPDANSAAAAEGYAQAVKGETFDEREFAAAAESARSKLGSGTSVTYIKTADIQPLGPFVLLAGLLPLGFLLWRRNVV
jgi:hypothetical protein